ncbi:2,5-dioxovalerate dehydrogenase [Paramixta manurensis]|uniref:2,5-dioxovalerate dehydrogenase n=1 Tax=Paramixta manurensis TaxID=2740817 RepID=A0A6M8UJR7_9GAMM|nr:2,5-dioxovalerate dehydrogenase [Erwiniaceae bacterium PD-1]
MTLIRGEMIIGFDSVTGHQGQLRALNPATGQQIEPAFSLGGTAEVEKAAQLASAAFDTYRRTTPEQRARFLETIADEIVALGDELLTRAQAETALPLARLQGERGRTVGQLRLFARVLRDGLFHDATIDVAQPARQPLPRADLRMTKIALGPVAVFGASNFPFAFSVAGGDTASALAAGAPVIVKAHNAHPGVSELVGRAIQQAARVCAMPEGVFSLLFGEGNAIGEALVSHPAIKAVGFTGSRQGGMALLRIANARSEPIPLYAEMSSVNPVFLLPAALAARGQTIAEEFAASLTLGAGQFCTNPGLVVALDTPPLEAFITAAAQALNAKPATTMLTPAIFEAYQTHAERLAGQHGITAVAKGVARDAEQHNAAQAQLYQVDASQFLRNRALQEEVFGPAALLIRAQNQQELHAVAEALEGQLTATLQLDQDDYPLAENLLPILERKAGRILANGFPTGVEVCHAMVHGGPWPSTSNAMYTSVGAAAIARFLRPVCYQDLPDALLPPALREGNPLDIPRVVEGELQR